MSEKIKRALGNKEASVFIILVAVMLIATLFNPAFLTFSNIMDVMKGNATLGICSFGMLLIILTGGIDASVCGQLTLVCVVAGKIMANTQFDNIIVYYLLGIAIGAFTGMLNGLMVARLDLPPIIATLGLDSVLMGFLKYYTNGTWINAKELPPKIGQIGLFRFFADPNVNGSGVPLQLLLYIVVAALTWFLLNRMLLGRSIMAMGGSRVGAERIGLNARNLTTFAYMYAGMMYGFAAITYTCAMNSVDPNAFLGFEMDVIGAVVLGGALMTGGQGSVLGTVLGMLLFAFISNGLTLAHISTYWQNIIVGAIILLAVSFDMIKLHREERLQTKVDIEPKEAIAR